MARCRLVGRPVRRRPGGQRGASYLEFLALGVLAAIIVAVLVLAGLPGRLSDGVGAVVCRVTGTSCRNVASRNGHRPDERAGGPSLAPRPTTSASPRTPAGHPHPSPAASPTVDPAKIAQAKAEKVLKETPTGRAALDWITSHGVKVVYRKQRGVYFSNTDNVMYIDYRMSPEEIAAYFVHETNHARTRDYPPIDSMSRNAYIDRSIQEEAHGNVLQVKENQELQRKRGPGKVPDTLFQSEYESAYNSAVSSAESAAAKQGRTLSPTEKERIGEKAGEARMKQAIESGQIVQSTDGKTYRSHYAKEWDDAHAPTCVWFVCW